MDFFNADIRTSNAVIVICCCWTIASNFFTQFCRDIVNVFIILLSVEINMTDMINYYQKIPKKYLNQVPNPQYKQRLIKNSHEADMFCT